MEESQIPEINSPTASTEPLSLARCRELVGKPFTESLGDDEIERMRNMLYSLADVIVDAYLDLGRIDQGAFSPHGDPIDQMQRQLAQAIQQSDQQGVSQ